ncbi:MAG: hypothetical protein AAGE99_03110 [Chlamydiota bacterium]
MIRCSIYSLRGVFVNDKTEKYGAKQRPYDEFFSDGCRTTD